MWPEQGRGWGWSMMKLDRWVGWGHTSTSAPMGPRVEEPPMNPMIQQAHAPEPVTEECD